jgi:hypothetical protein
VRLVLLAVSALLLLPTTSIAQSTTFVCPRKPPDQTCTLLCGDKRDHTKNFVRVERVVVMERPNKMMLYELDHFGQGRPEHATVFTGATCVMNNLERAK